jgi:hypothetical protein
MIRSVKRKSFYCFKDGKIWDSFKRLHTTWSVSFKFVDKHVLCWGTIANIDQHLLIIK